MAKDLNIKYVPTNDLIPYVNNARKHSEKQINQIAASIKEFGFNNPVLTDGENGIIAGHGRVAAAQKLGLDTVPVVELKHLTPAQRKAYILADNRLAELSEWDTDLIKIELDELKELDFNVDLTGFDFNALADDFETEEDGDKYTRKTDSLQYEPSDNPPDIAELVDSSKTQELLANIEKSGVSEKEKQFLIKAAYRHDAFSFKRIADYYASASAEMQNLMEQSGLVIVDFDDAIQYGFVELSSKLDEIRNAR